jgi:hypothetical protein
MATLLPHDKGQWLDLRQKPPVAGQNNKPPAEPRFPESARETARANRAAHIENLARKSELPIAAAVMLIDSFEKRDRLIAELTQRVEALERRLDGDCPCPEAHDA